MKKKLTTWKKVWLILKEVCITLLSIRFPEAETLIDKKIIEIQKILNDDNNT